MFACFLVDWYSFRQSPNVLWLHFEDLKTDLRECVKLVASFMGIDPQDEALIDLAVRQVLIRRIVVTQTLLWWTG